MAVLRDRPLSHVMSLSMQNLNPFIAIFLSFSSRKFAERVHKAKKIRLIERKTHTCNDGSVDCKKTDSLGAQSLTSPASASLRLVLPYDLFFIPRDTQSVLVHFLPNMCLRKSRFLKFRRARPQCVVLYTLVLMYSW